jgi:hypothetical protein
MKATQNTHVPHSQQFNTNKEEGAQSTILVWALHRHSAARAYLALTKSTD